jgi:hypothetical protein
VLGRNGCLSVSANASGRCGSGAARFFPSKLTRVPLSTAPMVLLREREVRRCIGAIEPCLPSPAKEPPPGLDP